MLQLRQELYLFAQILPGVELRSVKAGEPCVYIVISVPVSFANWRYPCLRSGIIPAFSWRESMKTLTELCPCPGRFSSHAFPDTSLELHRYFILLGCHIFLTLVIDSVSNLGTY
jgi:hypothetical protein